MMDEGRERLWRWDRGLLVAALLLAVMSVAAMFSAGSTVSARLPMRHAVWAAIGVALFLGVAQTSYHRWMDLAIVGYGATLIALLIVPLAGAMRLGATRWLSLFGFSLQPSEVAKLSTVWLLARYLAGQPVPLSGRVIATSLLLVGPPALLIFLQPDLGSASIFGAIWFVMVWVAGASRRTLVALGAVCLAVAPLGWHALKAYQRARLMAFLDPYADPLGAGFSIIQSTIAIGSGQWWGRGWRAGTQSRLNFLPERHSDFIFAVIGEEWGLVGGVLMVILFAVVVTRAIRIAQRSADPQAVLTATGIAAWLGYQSVVNVGMVMGLLPIVGVPLPLVSYGGSSMVMVWIAIGLLQNIHSASRHGYT